MSLFLKVFFIHAMVILLICMEMYRCKFFPYPQSSESYEGILMILTTLDFPLSIVAIPLTGNSTMSTVILWFDSWIPFPDAYLKEILFTGILFQILGTIHWFFIMKLCKYCFLKTAPFQSTL